MTKKKNPEDYLKVGRPTVMTPEAVGKLEQAFSMGCSDSEACLFANVSRQALYDYQARNPEFAERKALLKDRLIFKARTVIAESLNKGDENTAKWYLERKAKKEFSTREEITGAEGNAIAVSNEVDIEKIKQLKELIDG